MGKKLSNEKLRQLRRLQGEGIPFDPQVVNDSERASRGLSLFQTGDPAENRVFDLYGGGCGCTLAIAVCSDSDGVICVQQYRLEVPTFEWNFEWLEDPLRKSPRGYSYSFPPHGPVEFDREDVLNHRIGRKGRLNPRDSFEGLLLGKGQACLPDTLRDHQSMLAKLTIFDGRGDHYELEVNLWVSRQVRVGIEKRSPSRFDPHTALDN
jgi:hypothetical protein